MRSASFSELPGKLCVHAPLDLTRQAALFEVIKFKVMIFEQILAKDPKGDALGRSPCDASIEARIRRKVLVWQSIHEVG